MKKAKIFLSLLLSVAMLASLISSLGLSSSAAESVTKTVEFTSLAENTTDKAAAAESIKSVGVYEVHNMQIQPTWAMCVTPGGYQGEGYIVVKVDAGEGKVFASDPVVDLTYWLADVSSKGYVTVEGSLDNETYYEFYKDETGLGGEYENGQSQNKQITLTGGAGAATVYVKVLAQHWGSMYCGAIQKVVVTGDVQDDPNAGAGDSGADDGEATGSVSATVDMSNMAATNDKTAAAETIKAAGAYEVSNMRLENTYFGTAHPGGYQGEGYIVVKLDAGEGKVFASDPVVDLTYWLADVVNPEVNVHGSIRVEGSLDNETYYEFYKDATGLGGEYENGQSQNKQITLTPVIGATTVYVKVTVQHWGSPYCGAIQKIIVSGDVKDDPNATPDDGGEQPDGDTVAATIDLSAKERNEDKDASAVIIKEAGAYEVSNLMLENSFFGFAHPGGYGGAGYIIVKLDAGEGKVFAADPVLDLTYWLAPSTHNVDGTKGYLKVEGSLDNETYYEFFTNNEGAGEAFQLSAQLTEEVTLTGGAGAATVYAKITVEHFGAPHCGAIQKIVLTGAVQDDPNAGGNDDEQGGTGDEDDDATNTKVSKEYDFSSVSSGEVTAEDIGAISENGLSYNIDNMKVLSSKGGYMVGNAVWKLDAADGDTIRDAFISFTGYQRFNSIETMERNRLSVYVSSDGTNFSEVKKVGSGPEMDMLDTEIDASAYLRGESSMYVKLEWEIFDSPWVLGIESLKLEINRDGTEDTTGGDNNDDTTGGDNDDTTAGDDEVDPNLPPKSISSTLDFSTLEKVSDASDAILGLGAYDVSGLCIEDCHTKFTAPKDGHVPSFYVQRLSAGAGKTFLADPVLKLNYRLATSDPMSTIKIEVSTDGETYKEITTLNESTGTSFTNECKASKDITLTGVKGAEVVYVKVTMTRFGAHDTAGVDCSVINASVPGDKPSEDGSDTPTKTKTITNLLNFGKLQKYLGDATNILKGIGAVDASGLMVDDCYTPFISPKDGYAPAYYVQKLSAGEGATFTSDAALLLKYRMSDSDPQSTIKIEVSTDGENYTEVKTISEGKGTPFTTDCKANANITLPGTKGASDVYVKVTLTRFGSPDSAGVDSSLISAEVPDDGKGDTGSSDSPTTGNNAMPIAISVLVLIAALAAFVTTRKLVKNH